MIVANRKLWETPSTLANGFPKMAVAATREMVESALFDAKNGPDGIEFDRENLLAELQIETIDVDGVNKKYYQFIGKQIHLLF